MSRVLVLADCPGTNGRNSAFGAQYGATLAAGKMQREEFLTTYLDDEPSPAGQLYGLQGCRDLLDALTPKIERINPAVIVPLGPNCTTAVCGERKVVFDLQRGYVYPLQLGQWSGFAVPTYHPPFVLAGNRNLTQVHAGDFRRALRVAREGYQEPVYLYFTDPTVHDLMAFADQALQYPHLTADIETTEEVWQTDEDERMVEKREVVITRISFAYKAHHAITVPWTPKFFSGIQRLLKHPSLVFWNEDYDVPILRANAMELPGQIIDAMWMWHFLQSDLPKKLGFVASLLTELSEWKSVVGENMPFYSCRDADAQISLFYEIKRRLEAA